jgi:hypothetical protein
MRSDNSTDRRINYEENKAVNKWKGRVKRRTADWQNA